MNRHERRRRAAIRTVATPRRAGRTLLPGAIAAALLVAFAAVWAVESATPPAGMPGGHWVLTDAHGARVTDRDFRGRFMLLYFGYTECPDVCPTTLAAVADALRRLGSRADRLAPVFVTVDPGHDTPAVVGDYVRAFSPRLVGLTGSPSQIATVEREYDVRAVPIEGSSERGTTRIDHTAVLLLLGPDGRFLAPFPPDETGRALASRLARFLS